MTAGTVLLTVLRGASDILHIRSSPGVYELCTLLLSQFI